VSPACGEIDRLGRIVDAVRTASIGGYVAFRASDTGPGLASGVAGRAFEPFVTTKDLGPGRASGLGPAWSGQ
jgi:C4-dicarboxylate-specific signal transduction histidine kinase